MAFEKKKGYNNMDENELSSYEDFNKLFEEKIKEFKKRYYEDIEKVERSIVFEKIKNNLSENLNLFEVQMNKTFRKIKEYEYGFTLYGDPYQKYQEIDTLMSNYAKSQNNNEKIEIAFEIAKTYSGMEDWKNSVAILEGVLKENIQKESGFEIKARIYRELGFYKTKISLASFLEYNEGLDYLKNAIRINPKDADAYSILGGRWKYIDNKKAYKYYLEAWKLARDYSYPLVNVILLEIALKKRIKPIKRYMKYIELAIQKRKEQIKNSEDIPWAFYDLGTLYMLIGNIKLGFYYYLLGIRDSPDIWTIETTLKTLELATVVQEEILGFKQVRVLFLLSIGFFLKKLGIQNTYKWKEIKDKLINEGLNVILPKLENSIVICAGGVSNYDSLKLKELISNLSNALNKFDGVLISGCNNDDIEKLILSFYTATSNYEAYLYEPQRIKFKQIIGKIVRKKPVLLDECLAIIFQSWFEILNSPAKLNEIKMIGIDGNYINILEYYIAIAFGVPLCLIKDSQSAISELIKDPLWKSILDVKYIKKPYYLYKTVKNAEKGIKNFLESKYIKDPDLDNLQMFLIQNADAGTPLFNIKFVQEQIKMDLLSGYLKSFEAFGEEGLQSGKIVSLEFVDYYILGDFIMDNTFKLIFFLKNKPSIWLKDRISEFITRVEKEIGAELQDYASKFMVYNKIETIREIFGNIFGSEIFRLF